MKRSLVAMLMSIALFSVSRIALSFPTVVDLSSFQTPIKDQGGRDTCTVFATTAALEAAYNHKYGLTLDLSEQFLHHVQKSHWLDSTAKLPSPEIQPETNGGGEINWQFNVLTRYGLPTESALPYIGDGNWQNLSSWTSPSGSVVVSSQRALDDFNLSDQPVTYTVTPAGTTPDNITTTVFPSAALDGARYQPTATKIASTTDVKNLDWYRGELSAGREVAFMVNLTSLPPASSKAVWSPGMKFIGVHAMLIIGYDDNQQAFTVKNSWGGPFLLFSYAWATSGAITEAATILDVADPYVQFSTFKNKHLFLGRWFLDHDGWNGTLDIYRLPGDGSSSAPDLRVGTYFGPDGVARRVNGKITDNHIDFYLDWNTPDISTTAVQGMHFTGYVFTSDHNAMAGTMLDNRDNGTYPFKAIKDKTVTGVPRASTSLSFGSYWGTWVLETDGAIGTLNITSVSATGGGFSGNYIVNGSTYSVTGAAGPDPRVVTFTIASPVPVTYNGYLNGHELGVMSGTIQTTSTYGFYAYRVSDPPQTSTSGGGGSGTTTPPGPSQKVCNLKPWTPGCP
jgi:hypothetical protein